MKNAWTRWVEDSDPLDGNFELLDNNRMKVFFGACWRYATQGEAEEIAQQIKRERDSEQLDPPSTG